MRAPFLLAALLALGHGLPALAAETRRLPPNWNAKEAGDRVLAGLVNVSAPEVKGAHDAEMTLVKGRAYLGAEANDVKAGEAPSWPPFDRLNGVYNLGWQERTRIAGVSRSIFNLDVSHDGANWERKYRFATVKSFQYPTSRAHDDLSVTQGDNDASRKERIMSGRLK